MRQIANSLTSGAARLAAAALFAAALPQAPVLAQATIASAGQHAFADLADLAIEADAIVVVAIEDQIRVKAERAPGLAPGHARLYLKARTLSLPGGSRPLGESLAFLADVPLLANGKVPDLEKQNFIIFAHPVEGRPGQLRLAGEGSMLPHTPAAEQRVRDLLRQITSAEAPPIPTEVRDLMSVRGNLAGESETQIFLETERGAPLALNVIRRPGMSPQWGVSYTEILDQAAQAPEPDTLEWYRLACFLPRDIPDEAFLQEDPSAREQARADYALILERLGPCARTRGRPVG